MKLESKSKKSKNNNKINEESGNIKLTGKNNTLKDKKDYKVEIENNLNSKKYQNYNQTYQVGHFIKLINNSKVIYNTEKNSIFGTIFSDSEKESFFPPKIYLGIKRKGILILEEINGKYEIIKHLKIPKSITKNGKRIELQVMDHKKEYLVAGGRDGNIYLWVNDILQKPPIIWHKKPITSIKLSEDSNYLFCGSKDMKITYWNINEKILIDSFYGHNGPVFSIDIYSPGKSLSVGSSDSSVRLWKTEDLKQLIYSTQINQIDAISTISNNYFITGDHKGNLKLWIITKKKPINSISIGQPIIIIKKCLNSNIIFVGTEHGKIFIIKIDDEKLEIIMSKEFGGMISSIDLYHNPSLQKIFLVFVSANERPQGRWNSLSIKNTLYYSEILI